MVEPILASVEKLTGVRAMTCPWAAFRDLLVIDAVNTYPLFESGQLAMRIGDDPPAVVMDAIMAYHAALSRAGDVQRKEREAERASNDRHAQAVAQMKRGAR